MPDIDQFLEILSSADPVPGGGSVAALDAALAASLLAMVANLTVGRKRYVDVEQQAVELRDAACVLRDRARSLMQADEDAYLGVSRAMALPRDSDSARNARSQAVQEALKGAVGPPRDTMWVAQQIVQLAQRLVQFGNRSAVSDIGTAVLSARSAYHAALLNVDINLKLIEDADWVEAVRSDLDVGTDIDRAEREVLASVHDIIEGSRT